MKNYWITHKVIILDELRSFLTGVFTWMIIDGGAQILGLVNGTAWDQVAFNEFSFLILRSVGKELLTQIFPSLFPRRSSLNTATTKDTQTTVVVTPSSITAETTTQNNPTIEP